MILIVGLGNPGKNYENTYHNMGFMALDFYIKSKGVTLTKKKGNALIYEGPINGKKVILAKPQTFMNLSGTSVASLVASFKIEPSKALVIYDDIDLEQGAVRFRNSGSAGTHNGMKDVVKDLNTTSIPRVRIGVGQDLVKGRDLADYVLSKVQRVEDFKEPFEKVASLIDEFIEKDGALENKSVI